MRRKILTTVLVGAIFVLMSGAHAQENTMQGEYAPVNGLNLYYEVHGTGGEPLILLHGGLGGIVEFAPILPLLAETRQVIAVELQGHGHTADIDRPLTFENMADDVAALIDYLGLEHADILGYSLGGGVALQTAIRHPEVVHKLVLISTSFRSSGIHPEFKAGMAQMSAESAQMMLETPMYQFYSSVAPRVEAWAALVDKLGTLLREDYDWSEQAAQVTTPTLIVHGDSDWLPPSEAVALFGLLGGGVAGGFAPPSTSQLAILPNTIHFTIMSRTDLLMPIITPFLDAPAQQAP